MQNSTANLLQSPLMVSIMNGDSMANLTRSGSKAPAIGGQMPISSLLNIMSSGASAGMPSLGGAPSDLFIPSMQQMLGMSALPTASSASPSVLSGAAMQGGGLNSAMMGVSLGADPNSWFNSMLGNIGAASMGGIGNLMSSNGNVYTTGMSLMTSIHGIVGQTNAEATAIMQQAQAQRSTISAKMEDLAVTIAQRQAERAALEAQAEKEKQATLGGGMDIMGIIASLLAKVMEQAANNSAPPAQAQKTEKEAEAKAETAKEETKVVKKPAAAKTEPAKADAVKTEAVKAEPAKTEPAKAEVPAKTTQQVVKSGSTTVAKTGTKTSTQQTTAKTSTQKATQTTTKSQPDEGVEKQAATA